MKSFTLSSLRAHQSDPYVGLLLKAHLEENPQSKIKDRRRVFISFCNSFSVLKVSQLSGNKLRDWFLQLQEQIGCTDRNLIHIKSDLNHFFRYLMVEGLLPKNP